MRHQNKIRRIKFYFLLCPSTYDGENFAAFPGLIFSILYGTLLYLKVRNIPSDDTKSIFLKKWNWIFTLLFLFYLLLFFFKQNSPLYLYGSLMWINFLFLYELRKYKKSIEPIFDHEDILDSGEIGRK